MGSREIEASQVRVVVGEVYKSELGNYWLIKQVMDDGFIAVCIKGDTYWRDYGDRYYKVETLPFHTRLSKEEASKLKLELL